MNPALAGGLACSLYLVSAALQFFGQSPHSNLRRAIIMSTALLAVLLHGLFSYQEIYTPAGINIGIYPMASLTSLAIAVIVLASSIRRPVDNLLVLLFPFATLTVLLALFQEGSYTPRNDIDDGIVAHILLSVTAYSLLTVAAFQAALLSIGDYELKHRNLGVLKRLPPLQTMESLMFELIWFGLVFLSMSIATGFIFLGDAAVDEGGLIHHTVITLAAWTVYAILLWGRLQLGWRGAIASRWTLAGFALLVLGYFGSKLVLELILGRS
ncbi:MAG: ABC-type uncharacterized transport system permease subunit [Patiriisocius sp.]|jgi:ABC-type uncharacterized transport system permease subunit